MRNTLVKCHFNDLSILLLDDGFAVREPLEIIAADLALVGKADDASAFVLSVFVFSIVICIKILHILRDLPSMVMLQHLLHIALSIVRDTGFVALAVYMALDEVAGGYADLILLC